MSGNGLRELRGDAMAHVYEKPYLEKVIIRLDLASPSFDVAEGLPGEVTDALLQRFPIIEPREIKSAVLEISPSSAKASPAPSETHWALFGRDREKDLLIAPNHFYIEQRRYESYVHLKADFDTVLDVLATAFPVMRASRFGLRYINKIPTGRRVQTTQLAGTHLPINAHDSQRS